MRFDGEQALLGFQDCFILFLCDLGWFWVGFWEACFIYSGHKKEGVEGGRSKKFQQSWLMVYWGGLGFCSFLAWLCLCSLILSKPNTVTVPPFPILCGASWFKLSWEVLSEICQRFGMLGHFVPSLWLKHTLNQHNLVLLGRDTACS